MRYLSQSERGSRCPPGVRRDCSGRHWQAIEAISKMRGGPKLKADYVRIGQRRGVNIARVAVARKLLVLVYYGLRDGEIRCLARADEAG